MNVTPCNILCGCKQVESVQGLRALQVHLLKLPGLGVQLDSELWECLETTSWPICAQGQVNLLLTARVANS